MVVADELQTNSPPPRRWYKSKWFNLTIGLIVTIACLAYALT